MALVRDYITSLVNLYGVVHKSKVVEIYNEQNNDGITEDELDRLIHGEPDEMLVYYVHIVGDYFAHEAVAEVGVLEQELEKKVGKPFYVPKKHKLLRYTDEDYYEKSKHYKALLRYVTKHLTDGDKEWAEDISDELQGICEFDFNLDNIFGRLNQMGVKFDGEKQVKEMLDLIVQLANNTRIWENNGFTPNELERYNMNPKPQLTVVQGGKNLGRNDPCPCGSGKKYKKCCLS